MEQGAGQQSGRRDPEDAVRAVRTMAKREELLQQARTKLHWSDGISMALGVVWFFLAYRSLQSVEAYKSYDMSKLTPIHLLSPAIYFAFGLLFLNQTFISAAVRRLNALVQLLDPSEQR